MGVCLSNLKEFGGLGESLQLCPRNTGVGHRGITGVRAVSVFSQRPLGSTRGVWLKDLRTASLPSAVILVISTSVLFMPYFYYTIAKQKTLYLFFLKLIVHRIPSF